MIVHLSNREINRELWDNCVKNTQGAKPYGYSWYLDLMAPEWEALVQDDYSSVFPLPAFKKYGINYISTPVFVQRLGVFSQNTGNPAVINEFLESIPEYFRLIDLCVAQNVRDSNFKVTVRTNFELDMALPYGQLWNNFTHHCKRNIDVSAREKHDLINDITSSELIHLFRENRGGEIRELKDHHYNQLDVLMNYCIQNSRGKIIGVRDTGRKLIFGIFLIETGLNRIMLFVVNTPESRSKRIGYFVVNELIKESAGSGMTLDFEGSSIPSVASFMESFGSMNVPFYRVYRNTLPWPIRMLK
jgi:hypothetical protein